MTGRAAGWAAVVDGHVVGRLLDGGDLGAEADVRLEVLVERARQQVHAAGDLLHVLERAADDLAQLLDDRRVHVRLAEAHHAVQLERALGEAAHHQELARSSTGRSSRSSASSESWPPSSYCSRNSLRGFVPELRPGLALLVVGKIEGQLISGCASASATVMRWPSMWTSVLGIAHHERPQLEPEQVAVGQRQVVDARDAHRARLGVQPGREVADRLDAAADAVLRLEDQRLVALPLELERGDQTGDAAADDDHPLARLRQRFQTLTCAWRRSPRRSGAWTQALAGLRTRIGVG